MIEAVLFDYGLVLSGPADPAAWARMLAITGLDEERFRAAYWAPRHDYDRGHHTGADYWRAVGLHAGGKLNRAQVSALMAEDTELWTQPNQPMIDWAARLQHAGIRTGILSNLGDDITAGVLRKMPWLNQFNCRIFSYTLKLAKPDPAIYRHAAEALGMKPEQVLFVDDRAENCAEGRAAGMQVIQYGDHATFVAELERRGWARLWHEGRVAVSESSQIGN